MLFLLGQVTGCQTEIAQDYLWLMIEVEYDENCRRLESIVYAPKFVKILENVDQFECNSQDSVIPLEFPYILEILV